MARAEFLGTRKAGIHLTMAQHRPVGGIGLATFVAHPPATGAAIGKDDGFGREPRQCVIGTGKIVVGALVYAAPFVGSAIPSVATIGTIEPHFEKRTVALQQLGELEVVVVYIGGCAVRGLMAIPGREVKAQLQSILPARGCQLAHHIALAAAIGRLRNGVVGILRGPQAEPVVVLGSEYNTLHAGGLERSHPLVGVEPSGVEEPGRRITIAPLHIVVGVQSIVNEGVCFHLLPPHLFGFGHRQHLCRGFAIA